MNEHQKIRTTTLQWLQQQLHPHITITEQKRHLKIPQWTITNHTTNTTTTHDIQCKNGTLTLKTWTPTNLKHTHYELANPQYPHNLKNDITNQTTHPNKKNKPMKTKWNITQWINLGNRIKKIRTEIQTIITDLNTRPKTETNELHTIITKIDNWRSKMENIAAKDIPEEILTKIFYGDPLPETAQKTHENEKRPLWESCPHCGHMLYQHEKNCPNHKP